MRKFCNAKNPGLLHPYSEYFRKLKNPDQRQAIAFLARYPTGIILLFSVVGVAAAAEIRRIRLLYCTATDERLHTTYLAWPRQ